MGIFASKPPTPEEERKRKLAQRGVLIPPSFGVSSNTLESQHYSNRLCFDGIAQQLPCNRLLQDFIVQPGLWISASTTTGGSVLASYTQNDENAMLVASHQFSNDGPIIQVRADSGSGATPRVEACQTFRNGFHLHGTMHSSGSGRVGCRTVDLIRLLPSWNSTTKPEYYRNNPFAESNHHEENSDSGLQVQLGSWADFSVGKQEKHISHMTGFGCIKARDYIAAVEGTVPVNKTSNNDMKVSYLASFDLNSNGPSPLTVTLTRTPSESKMALSQLISFDRVVTNLLEERCPKIRNTIGWSVQMASKDITSNSNDVSAACAWQINRGLALKVLASPTRGITTGILLKRWNEPRVTCCLFLGQHNRGIHVEIETGPPFWQSEDLYANAASSDEGPVTKTSLARK